MASCRPLVCGWQERRQKGVRKEGCKEGGRGKEDKWSLLRDQKLMIQVTKKADLTPGGLALSTPRPGNAPARKMSKSHVTDYA